MAKDTYYFPHDYTPTDDPKIMGLIAEYGAVGYGLYWRIVELLHNDPKHQLEKHQYLIVAIAKQMNSNPDFLLQFIEDCTSKFALFTQENNIITCQRVNRNIDDRQRKTDIAKANGSKGGVAKAKQNVATAKQNVAIKGKERKGKEIKGKEIKGDERKIFIPPTALDVLEYFTENGYSEYSARKAFKYYDDAKWIDGKGNKVRNWKQKMQGVWFKPENEKNKTHTTPAKYILTEDDKD